MAELFIYIIVHPHGDRSKICVIDLQHDLAYEKHDWCLASKNEWTDRDEAIAVARVAAINHGLTYILFESRYDEEYNEYSVDEDGIKMMCTRP